MLDFLLDCSTVRYVIGSKSVNLSLAAFFFFSSYSSISSVLSTIDRNLISISFLEETKKKKKKKRIKRQKTSLTCTRGRNSEQAHLLSIPTYLTHTCLSMRKITTTATITIFFSKFCPQSCFYFHLILLFCIFFFL